MLLYRGVIPDRYPARDTKYRWLQSGRMTGDYGLRSQDAQSLSLGSPMGGMR